MAIRRTVLHSWFMVLVIMFSLLVAPVSVAAQWPGATTLPDSVTFEPETARMRPGDTETITVTGESSISAPTLQLVIPEELELIGDLSCTAGALSAPNSDYARSRPEDVGCSANATDQPEEGIWTVSAIAGNTRYQLVRSEVSVTFVVMLRDVGLTEDSYVITAPVAGIGTEERLVVNVYGASEANTAVQPTEVPTPRATPAAVKELVLMPETQEARAGDTVVIDLFYPELQGISSVAFVASSEDSVIVNIGRSNVDTDGRIACSVGYEDDLVLPDERDLKTVPRGTFPPQQLEVIIQNHLQPGDQLRVCVEMVGFASDQQVFAWNAEAVIEVMG